MQEAKKVVTALAAVRQRISAVSTQLKLAREPTLVAVSKTKPAALIKAAHGAGQRHFGENYVQELVAKASDKSLPSDIRWHFIGHLQSNKVKQLLAIPNLYMVESVDSQKLATALNKASKSGCEPSACTPLVKHVIDTCKALEFAGLMTIGKPEAEPTPDCFEVLRKCRDALAELKLDPAALELSMGMSADYELAIKHGSTNVRVGSTIFGHRDYSQELKASGVPTDDSDAGAGAGAGATEHKGEGGPAKPAAAAASVVAGAAAAAGADASGTGKEASSASAASSSSGSVKS